MSRRQAMVGLGLLWVLVGITLLGAVDPPRPEIIDLADDLRAYAWIGAGVAAIVTSGTARASVWSLGGLSLVASERMLSWLVAWLTGSTNAPDTKCLLYAIACYAVWMAARTPAGRP